MDLSSLAAEGLSIPEKKWYEFESKREMVFPVPIHIARERLHQALSTGIKTLSFWKPGIDCKGTFVGRSMDLSLTISGGRSRLKFRVIGQLLEHPNGCLLTCVMRDRIHGYLAINLAFLILILYFSEGVATVVFATLFFGAFLAFGAAIQRGAGVTRSTSLLGNIINGVPVS